MHFASAIGSHEVVQTLINNGADVNAIVTIANEGKTALMIAHEKNSEKMIELLIKAGAEE